MIFKRLVDLLMTVLLLLLMAFQVTGETAHAWIGMAMFALVLLHQGLNRPWYRALFKGRYGLVRSLGTTVNVLLLAFFVITAVSGMIMSFDIPFLDASSWTHWARRAHLAGAYWSFILMGVHLGLHWGLAAGRLPGGWKGTVLDSLAVLGAGYGLYLFLRADIPSYLFLITQFAFLDYEKAATLVLAENLAMMAFWVLLGYQALKGLTALVSKRWRALLHPTLMLAATGGFSALLTLIFGGASGG